MKAGDLVELPQSQGYAIVYDVTHSEPDGLHGLLHPFSTAIVIQGCGLDSWDASACKVISESKN